MKRHLAAVVAAAALSAIGADRDWSSLLRKGLNAARELQRQQAPSQPVPVARPPAPTAEVQSPEMQAAADQRPEVRLEATASEPIGTELLPLRRLPLITGAMGVNLLVEVDGTVKSWGDPGGEATYLGDGTTRGIEEPAEIPGLRGVVDAAVAPGHALVLLRDGTVMTWGRNRGCELTVKDDKKRLTPFVVKGVRNAVQVAAAFEFSATVLRDGTVLAWGNNESGMLANGRSGSSENCAFEPVMVEGLTGVKKLVVDNNAVAVLKRDGTVWGWGANKEGQLCDGTTQLRTRPVQMVGISGAVDIDADDGTVIVLDNGTVWRCGPNALAQSTKRPDSVGMKKSQPVPVAGIAGAVAARASGYGTTFVRLRDGTLRGWGSGIFGALGNGSVEGDSSKPSAPIGLGPVLDQFWASNSAYAIRADGTVMAWGFYTGGRANAKNEWQLTPVAWRKVQLAD
ncbi:MAG: hypothetical protein HXX19_09125 [Rhodoferax sp.]|nr:hypothetical protein [Rhodoferax sp.]